MPPRVAVLRFPVTALVVCFPWREGERLIAENWVRMGIEKKKLGQIKEQK